MVRTLRADVLDPARLTAAKGRALVSVCIPARNEASTIGAIVESIRSELVDGCGLVDELLVVDDHSDDETASIAEAAGATVVQAANVLADHGEGHGKGEAMWKSLHVSRGDLVVWCDADLRDFDPQFVVGLVAPLLHHQDVAFVKGFYERPIDTAGDGGGRVTELVARPVIALAFPELAPIVQPLGGEYAGRRNLLERLPFVEGYGVDLALLVDASRTAGVGAVAQVDLGVRHHRHRRLDELGPQALAVLQAALSRADDGPTRPGGLVVDGVPALATLVRPGHPSVESRLAERPPLVTVAEYRATHRRHDVDPRPVPSAVHHRTA